MYLIDKMLDGPMMRFTFLMSVPVCTCVACSHMCVFMCEYVCVFVHVYMCACVCVCVHACM